MSKSLERRRLLDSSKEARRLELDLCARDPAYFLWNDQRYVWTFDQYERDDARKIKVFQDKPYLRYVLDYLHNRPVTFMPKSRQLFVTWLVCGYLWWDARFRPFELNFAQSKKEEDAANLVFNREWTVARISFMESMLPEWMRDHGATTSYGIVNFSNGSRIWGIPQGGDIIRSYTPSIVFLDEAAFQPEAERAYTAASAAARQIIAVSSAEPSWFGVVTCLQADPRKTHAA